MKVLFLLMQPMKGWETRSYSGSIPTPQGSVATASDLLMCISILWAGGPVLKKSLSLCPAAGIASMMRGSLQGISRGPGSHCRFQLFGSHSLDQLSSWGTTVSGNKDTKNHREQVLSSNKI